MSSSGAGAVPRLGLPQAVQSLVYILVVALFIITFIAQPFLIPSASMEPTLLIGDFMLVNKEVSTGGGLGTLFSASPIHRGDLIVFHYPVNPSMDLIKRVVGLPGDRLRLEDGHVYIDGRAQSEPYAVFHPSPADSYRDDFPRMDRANPEVDSRWWIEMHSLVSGGQLTIPPDRYFVLGDNRNDSEDSRYWGLVPGEDIIGRPFLIYFSLNHSASRGSSPSPAVEPGKPASGAAATAPLRASPNSLFNFARWGRILSIPR